MGKDRWSHGKRGHKRGGYNRGGFGHNRGRGRGSGPIRGRGFDGRNRLNQPWPKRETRETPEKRLSEEEIGVTEYMSNHEGFNGIIKLRFSDFQVSEVNEQGEVAKLTDLTPPVQEEEEVLEDEELLLKKYNVEILPMETWDQINIVSLGRDPNLQKVEIDMSTSTKEERTKIHDAVKKAFGESIVGSTVNNGDVKIVRFEKYKKGVRQDRRVKWPWGGQFVHFVLYKEHCDTMEAASRITERLRLHPSTGRSLAYSGTKDRRAKTSQWFSIKKVEPVKIAAACEEFNNIAVGNFSFKDYGLKLGMLKGNQFRIALRNVSSPRATIATACQRLASGGFLNYYGLQRFGNRSQLPTYVLGRLLLQARYAEALQRALSAGGAPAEGAARARRALAAAPGDLQGALFKIPRNTRLLYLHSYQSLIWNRAVSERLRRFGLTPAPGDLVPVTGDPIKEELEDCESDTEEAQETDKNSQANSENRSESNNKSDKSPQEKIPIKVLTQEDVDSGHYSIFDIVMPLPGYLVQYPPNMKDYYETQLKNDELDLTLKNKNKNFSLSGTYRRMAVLPENLQWSCVRYNDPYGDLILSDLDILEGRTETAIVEDGEYQALLLSFTLPASCYATMALRELLKVDTSSDNQASQNNYHKRKITGDGGSEAGGKRVKNSEVKGDDEGKGDSEVMEDVNESNNEGKDDREVKGVEGKSESEGKGDKEVGGDSRDTVEGSETVTVVGDNGAVKDKE